MKNPFNNITALPSRFPEANVNLTKPKGFKGERATLPVFTDGKVVISKWRIPFWARIPLLFHGNLWLFVVNGHTQPPIQIMAKRNIFTPKKDEPAQEVKKS